MRLKKRGKEQEQFGSISEIRTEQNQEGKNTMANRDKETSFPVSTDARGTVLSADVEFKGSLTFEGSLRVDGKFEGDISSPGTIHIGESGDVKAEITVGCAVVEGKIQGNITAEKKVELLSTAQLFGDIKASQLVINEGVTIVGKCDVNPGASKTGGFIPKKKSEIEEPKQEKVGAEASEKALF